MTDDSRRAPAGWYADTTQPGTERWWDGQAWTDHSRSIGAPPQPGSGFEPQPGTGFEPQPGTGFEPQPGTSYPTGAAPAGVPPLPAQPKQRSGCFGIATGVMVGIIAAMVILVGGCVAIVAVGLEAADDELDSVTTATPRTVTTSAGDTDADIGNEPSERNDGGGGEEIDDVVSCDRADSQTIVLEVVNNSPKTSSYILTVGYFDEAGSRLADEATFVNYLRPGERAIEEHFTFEEVGSSCEVIDAERFAAESIEGELAEVSPCEIGSGPDALGSVQASLSATNGTPETSDYAVEVAFVDADGIRRGSGAAFIESVRSGETAPSDVFTTLDHADGYSCEVVAVTRNAS